MHNQENAQMSPDPFPRERVGSGYETTTGEPVDDELTPINTPTSYDYVHVNISVMHCNKIIIYKSNIQINYKAYLTTTRMYNNNIMHVNLEFKITTKFKLVAIILCVTVCDVCCHYLNNYSRMTMQNK